MRTLALIFLIALSLPANAIELFGSGKRYSCVVDGDTIWLRGEKIRLQGFDTPETTTNICGGNREVALGKKATARLVELLNSGEVTFQRNGEDRYGRTLADFFVDDIDAGETLVAEGWPDGGRTDMSFGAIRRGIPIVPDASVVKAAVDTPAT